MADAKDVATVVQSALTEIGVTGKLHVTKDGKDAVEPLGDLSGDDVAVDVIVQDLGDDQGEDDHVDRRE